ncbi:MAG: hypothetical protein HY390_03830 [Deltaproteobacteria bacterium]|nr:hypothetical protein [Deltaproteobacteria bacterium]
MKNNFKLGVKSTFTFFCFGIAMIISQNIFGEPELPVFLCKTTNLTDDEWGRGYLVITPTSLPKKNLESAPFYFKNTVTPGITLDEKKLFHDLRNALSNEQTFEIQFYKKFEPPGRRLIQRRPLQHTQDLSQITPHGKRSFFVFPLTTSQEMAAQQIEYSPNPQDLIYQVAMTDLKYPEEERQLKLERSIKTFHPSSLSLDEIRRVSKPFPGDPLEPEVISPSYQMKTTNWKSVDHINTCYTLPRNYDEKTLEYALMMAEELPKLKKDDSPYEYLWECAIPKIRESQEVQDAYACQFISNLAIEKSQQTMVCQQRFSELSRFHFGIYRELTGPEIKRCAQIKHELETQPAVSLRCQ